MTGNGDFPWRDEDLLKQLYVEQELTQQQIAAKLGCNRRTIHNWMQEFGIESREQGPANPTEPHQKREVLERLYVEQGLSMGEVGDRLGVSRSTIAHWLDRHNLKRDDAPSDETVPLNVDDLSVKDRFWKNVRMGDEDECWEWTSTMSHGYGKMRVQGQQARAHRISYKLANDRNIVGQLVLHHCDNPICVNPNHLYLGSQQDNLADAIDRDRINPPTGEDHPSAKLTEAEVAEIKRCLASGEVQRDIAKEYGVREMQISRIKHEKNWSWVDPAEDMES